MRWDATFQKYCHFWKELLKFCRILIKYNCKVLSISAYSETRTENDLNSTLQSIHQLIFEHATCGLYTKLDSLFLYISEASDHFNHAKRAELWLMEQGPSQYTGYYNLCQALDHGTIQPGTVRTLVQSPLSLWPGTHCSLAQKIIQPKIQTLQIQHFRFITLNKLKPPLILIYTSNKASVMRYLKAVFLAFRCSTTSIVYHGPKNEGNMAMPYLRKK